MIRPRLTPAPVPIQNARPPAVAASFRTAPSNGLRRGSGVAMRVGQQVAGSSRRGLGRAGASMAAVALLTMWGAGAGIAVADPVAPSTTPSATQSAAPDATPAQSSTSPQPSDSVPSSSAPSTTESSAAPSPSAAPSSTARPAPRAQAVAAGCQTYPPTSFQVCGAIRDEYNRLGGPGSFLSFPKSNELTNPDGVGKRSEFLGGNIYWSPSTGAHFVAHDFLTKWGQYNYERGFLKYPTTDEIRLGVGSDGRRQEFQGGSMYFSFDTGTHTIYGLIKQAWDKLGAENSFLGFPTSDEQATPPERQKYGSRENLFQTGVIEANLTTKQTRVGNWSAYNGGAANTLQRSKSAPVSIKNLPPLDAKKLKEDPYEQKRNNPQRHGNAPQTQLRATASNGCPDGTTDYSSINKTEWNCESVTEDLSGYEAGIRKGEARGARIDDDSGALVSTAGFGRLHAGEDHNVGPHTVQLMVQDGAYCSPLGYLQRCQYSQIFHFDEDVLDTITLTFQQGPDTENRAPDSYDVGLITAYCRVGDPNVHKVGYCRSDYPAPFNGGKDH